MAEPRLREPRVPTSLLLLALLTLSACEKTVSLPPPGAERGGRIQYWPGPGETAVEILVGEITQDTVLPDRFRFLDVEVRLPSSAGVLSLFAPAASTATDDPEQELACEPPIRIGGQLHGQAVTGSASACWIGRGGKNIVFEAAEIHHRGWQISFTDLRADRDGALFWQGLRLQPGPPAPP